MSQKTRRTLAIILPLLLFAIFAPVYAAVSQGGWNPKTLDATGLPNREVKDILITVIQWAIVIIGLLGVIIFIYAGFMYLTAQGETDNIEKAKKIMIYAVVGIAVAVLGYVAVKTVNDLLVGNTSMGGAPSTADTSNVPPNTGGNPYPTTPPENPAASSPNNPYGGTSSVPMPVSPNMTGQ